MNDSSCDRQMLTVVELVKVYEQSVPTVNLPGGTAAAVPPPFRPGNTVLCGSRPLVTHCRLGDLLCLFVYPLFVTILSVCICVFCVFFVFWGLFSFVAFSFSTFILLVRSVDL